MPSLEKFWQFFEARPSGRAVLAEWRKRTGEAFDAIRGLLHPIDEPATSYPNPNPYGLPLQVIHHRDGSIVAVCAEGSGIRLELTREAIGLYRLSLASLRDAMAQALSLQPSRAPAGKPPAIPVGQLEPQPGSGFPVRLLVTTSPEALRTLVLEVVTNASTPCVILTPTRRRWSDALQEYVRARQSCLIPANEVVELDSAGRFVASGVWPTYRSAFQRLAMPESLVPAPPPFEFSKSGPVWSITYEGVRSPLPDSKGLADIHYLLTHQGMEIPVIKMVADVTGDVRFHAAGHAGPTLTDEARDSYARRYADLEQQLAEARRNEDLGRIASAQEEIAALATELAKATGLGGRSRKEADAAARIYRAVRGRITEAINNIHEENAGLARHLANSIKTGFLMSYRPDRHIEWCL